MMDMAGMDMTDADEEHLRNAIDFDKMTPHHQSAIEMAEALRQTTERREHKQLVETNITSQRAEVD